MYLLLVRTNSKYLSLGGQMRYRNWVEAIRRRGDERREETVVEEEEEKEHELMAALAASFAHSR